MSGSSRGEKSREWGHGDRMVVCGVDVVEVCMEYGDWIGEIGGVGASGR